MINAIRKDGSVYGPFYTVEFAKNYVNGISPSPLTWMENSEDGSCVGITDDFPEFVLVQLGKGE